MQIDIHEAADVWNLAHTILNCEQMGKTINIGQGFGGVGDSRHHLDWAADIRKLVDNDIEVRIMDHIYGDTPEQQPGKVHVTAKGLLRRFTHNLCQYPERYEDYGKFRKRMFE